MRHLDCQLLFTLSAVGLLACSETHCSRTATCDDVVDSGATSAADAFADVDAPEAASTPEPSEEAETAPRTPVPATTETAAVVDAGSAASESEDAVPTTTATLDGGVPTNAEPLAPVSDLDSGVASEPPVVVIGVPDRDAGSGDAGPAGCALGESRACQDAVGNCALGVEICDADGGFGACSVQPELVDSCVTAGDDATCDGIPNEGCECTSGEERACGPEVVQGICLQGTSVCDAGVWGPCEGAVFPAPRQCGSPLDNDCNGEPDDVLDGVCQCAAGSTQSCDAHPGFDGVGPCTAGVESCIVSEDATNSGWGPCIGAVGPLAGDLCTTMGDDSNCNGIPSQGCDFTPPAVVASVPADGATGVLADDDIVLTFSEPMDPASTEDAIALSNGSALSFTWNQAGTVVTIDPTNVFEYAEGEFEQLDELEPRMFTVSVGSGAKDLAGNTLMEAAAVEFGTLRRVKHALALGTAAPYSVYSVYQFTPTEVTAAPCHTSVSIGYPDYVIALLAFDLSALDASVHDVLEATLVGLQSNYVGNPFDEVGPVEVEHVVVENYEDAFEADTLRQLGVLAHSPALGTKSLDVTPAAKEDVQLRGERANQSEYRVQLPRISPHPSDAQYVSFSCADFRLNLTYLMP